MSRDLIIWFLGVVTLTVATPSQWDSLVSVRVALTGIDIYTSKERLHHCISRHRIVLMVADFVRGFRFDEMQFLVANQSVNLCYAGI